MLMSFHPEVGDEIKLFSTSYSFTKHPAVVGIDMPYGQEGRQGTVYQLKTTKAGRKDFVALKVFRDRFRGPNQVGVAQDIKPYAELPGLRVCARKVVEIKEHEHLLSTYEDLQYSLMMPWIEGPTWADIIVDEKKITSDESLYIACMFTYILRELEQRELAHCDLSSSNIILPFFSTERRDGVGNIEFVDVEEMYAPHLTKPKSLPGGSFGYAPYYIKEGKWCKEADRFSGAVLLAEMISWHSDEVRKNKADDASYFKPDEIGQNNDRFKLLLKTISRTLGPESKNLFKKVWKSKKLEDCPTFKEWYNLFPENVRNRVEEDVTRIQGEKGDNELSVQDHLDIAAKFEGLGQKDAAELEYRYVVHHFQEHKSIVKEIEMFLDHPYEENSRPFIVQDYLEAAAHFEKLYDYDQALLFYKRASMLPSIEPSFKTELQFIMSELAEKRDEESGQKSTTETFQELLKEDEEKRPVTPIQTRPFTQEAKKPAKQKVGTFVKKRWIMISVVTLVIVTIGVTVWAFRYSANEKWETTLAHGTEAYEKGDYLQAEEYFKSAMEQKKKPEVYLKLGQLYLATGENDKASMLFDEAFQQKELSKSSQKANYLAGQSYYREKTYAKAISYFEQGYEAKKSSYYNRLVHDLVESYIAIGKLNKANYIVEDIPQDDAESQALYQYLKGELFSVVERYDEALTYYKKAVELEGTRDRHVEALSDTYALINAMPSTTNEQKRANYEEGISILAVVLKEEPKNEQLLARLGRMHYDFGQLLTELNDNGSTAQYRKALDDYKTALGLGVKSENLLINTALASNKVGDKKGAEAYFKTAREDYPNSSNTLFVYAKFKLGEKQYKEAETYFNQVIEMNDNEEYVQSSKDAVQKMKESNLL